MLMPYYALHATRPAPYNHSQTQLHVLRRTPAQDAPGLGERSNSGRHPGHERELRKRCHEQCPGACLAVNLDRVTLEAFDPVGGRLQQLVRQA
jgi:hypothetical protein